VSAIHCYGCIALYYFFGDEMIIEDIMGWSMAYFLVDTFRCLYRRDYLFTTHHLVAIYFAQIIIQTYSTDPNMGMILHLVYINAEKSNILMYPVYCLLHSRWVNTRFTRMIQVIHFSNYGYHRIFKVAEHVFIVSNYLGFTIILGLLYGVYIMGMIWSVKLLLQVTE
jgi:hypothetical protein